MSRRVMRSFRTYWETHAAVALVALAFAASLLMRIADPDTFMHTAVGRNLVRGGSPWNDVFSFAASYPNIRYSEVVAQIFFYTCVAAFGLNGLIVVHATLSGVMVWMATRVAAQPGVRATTARVVVGTLVALASFPAMSLKPQIFSYLMFAGLPWLLRARSPIRTLLYFVLWSNLHRGGVLGLAAVFVHAAIQVVCVDRMKARLWCLITVAATCGALLNTGGTFYLTSAFDVAQRESFHQYIAEWQPLTWSVVWDKHAAILPLALLAAVELVSSAGYLVRTRNQRERVVPRHFWGTSSWFARIPVATFAAFSGARLLPFFAIAVAPLAIRCCERIFVGFYRKKRSTDRIHAPRGFALLIAVVAAAYLFHSIEARIPYSYRGLGVQVYRVPVRLTSFLQNLVIPALRTGTSTADRPLRIRNDFGFGGYFMWKLFADGTPTTRILIDGRNDTLYGDQAFLTSLRTDTDGEAFQQLQAEYRFDVACFASSSLADPRGAYLGQDPAWALVYADDIGIIFVRKAAFDAVFLANYSYRELQRTAATAMRVLTLSHTVSDERLWNEIRRNVHEAPNSIGANFLLAQGARARGDDDALQQARERLAELADERGVVLPPI